MARPRKLVNDDLGRHEMIWDLGLVVVLAFVALLFVVGDGPRASRSPEGYGTRITRRATYSIGYQDGFQAGYRSAQAESHLPPRLWQHMLVLVHPDHHEGSPLQAMAAEVTRWLLTHRPKAGA
jgi:hypothetical protein